MKKTRFALMVVSIAVVLLLVGGGLAVRVGAADNTYGQVVLFSEILSLVSDNYVDPVETGSLLDGAYEGMLSGLDARGAFLTAEEVAEWRGGARGGTADPGVSVLKGYGALQIVAVAPDSPASDAGLMAGDQIRRVDDRETARLSLDQSLRLVRGEPGTTVKFDVIRLRDGFKREVVELERVAASGPAYDVEVRDGIALLTVRSLPRVDPGELASELDDIRTRGVERLLVDLRNLAGGSPVDVAGFVGAFAPSLQYRLRDRAGEVVEAVDAVGSGTAWQGELAVLVNGATAGAAEAVALGLRTGRLARVFGEATYGLGTEVELFELPDGSGLLLSSRIWELGSGEAWNEDGIEPDEVVNASGATLEERMIQQLRNTLERYAGGDADVDLPDAA